MTDEIKPALSAEDWVVYGPKVYPDILESLAFQDDYHAVAALALHNQPFGFTQDEVSDLVDLLGLVDWESIEGLRNSLTSVLTKVRALLPPESR